VKDVTGNPEHDSNTFKRVPRGQSLEVTFQDGEKIAGTTETYSHNDVGFFLSPADPDSNNVRIFVVNKNVREVKLFM
jgi:hypothetical protein